MRHLPLACLFAICAACAAPALAESPLAANKEAPPPVRQDAGKASEIAATLKGIKLPLGFNISLFAIVPDARDMAVSADGRKVFVGTAESDAYVLDLKGAAGPVASVKASTRRGKTTILDRRTGKSVRGQYRNGS